MSSAGLFEFQNIANSQHEPIDGSKKSAGEKIQEFKKTPLYSVLLHGGLFVAGVAFIQSSVMDMLAPQL